MSAPKNPPAFPSQLHEASRPGDHDPQEGMTLRDYFAGQALAGIAANFNWLSAARRADYSVTEAASASAYEFADAMLAERAKSGGAA